MFVRLLLLVRVVRYQSGLNSSRGRFIGYVIARDALDGVAATWEESAGDHARACCCERRLPLPPSQRPHKRRLRLVLHPQDGIEGPPGRAPLQRACAGAPLCCVYDPLGGESVVRL